MLKSYVHDNSELGQYFENEEFIVFFGNSQFDYKLLTKIFSYDYSCLKQVHGNNVIQVDDELFKKNIEADGQWTNKKRQALVIETADCLPIFWYSAGTIAALHCGWKSLQLGIIAESHEKTQLNPTHAFMGPHIQYDSFEVESDVAQYFPNFSKQTSEVKFCVNLAKNAQAQLSVYKLNTDNVTTSNIDTLTNKAYNSYRRDRFNSKRNLSFIALK